MKSNDKSKYFTNLIKRDFAIKEIFLDAGEIDIPTCIIVSNDIEVKIRILTEYDLYLITTTRFVETREITFEAEFWFEDYNNKELIKNFNLILADFTTKTTEELLDDKYPCQIIYN